MANIYTDEVRIVQYEKLKKQKKAYEAVFAVCMLLLLIIAFAAVFQFLFQGAIWGLFLNEMGDFWMGIGLLICSGFSIYALFQRDWRWLVPVTIVVGFLTGGLFAIPLLPAAITSFFWEKLKNEEGFPDFKITQVEQNDRQQAIVKNLEQRAVAEGTRIRQESLNADAGMGDLLDQNSPQVLPADLRGYHERSRDVDAAVQPIPQHDDRMDSLEDL